MDRSGSRVVVSGTKEEDELVRLVMKGLPKSTRLPHMSLRQFAACLSRMNALVTNSTGPLHLAVALRIPSVSLYCPIRTCLPVRWGPYPAKGEENSHVVFVPSVDACDCSSQKCRLGDCMRMIQPEEVWKSCQSVMSKREVKV